MFSEWVTLRNLHRFMHPQVLYFHWATRRENGLKTCRCWRNDPTPTCCQAHDQWGQPQLWPWLIRSAELTQDSPMPSSFRKGKKKSLPRLLSVLDKKEIVAGLKVQYIQKLQLQSDLSHKNKDLSWTWLQWDLNTNTRINSYLHWNGHESRGQS